MTEVRDQMSEVKKHRSGTSYQLHRNGRFLGDVCCSVLKPISDLRLLISGLCAFFLALGVAASAQQPGRLARVGVLISGSSITAGNMEAFRQRLRELGYVEGQNLTLELRYSDGKTEQLTGHAAELVRLRVDVIAAFGAPAIMAAKQSTTTIPIVFETLADAVAMGFVPNLTRPGGNITGVTGFASEVAGKWLELLGQIAPKTNELVCSATRPIPTLLRSQARPRVRRECWGCSCPSRSYAMPKGGACFCDADKRVRRSPHHTAGSPFQCAAPENRDFGSQAQVANHLRDGALSCGRRVDVLWNDSRGQLAPRGGVRGQDPERRQAGRPAGGAGP